MLAPEFVSVFFGLKPTTADAIKDIGYSSLRCVTVVLFPRTIAFSQGHIERESVSLKTKVFAWAMNRAWLFR